MNGMPSFGKIFDGDVLPIFYKNDCSILLYPCDKTDVQDVTQIAVERGGIIAPIEHPDAALTQSGRDLLND